MLYNRIPGNAKALFSLFVSAQELTAYRYLKGGSGMFGGLKLMLSESLLPPIDYKVVVSGMCSDRSEICAI